MSDQSSNPLSFLQGMWNQMGFQLPGMVTPTLDEGELDKQIKDLKSVENWLRMNLSMLQMTIQNLEMQKSALGTFRTMSAHFTQPEASGRTSADINPFFRATMTSSDSPAQPVPDSPDVTTPSDADEAALAKAAMWPWEMMNDLNAKMQAQLAEAAQQSTAAKPARKAATKSTAKPTKNPAAKKAVRKATAGTRTKQAD